MLRRTALLGPGALLLAHAGQAAAPDTWPNKSIRFIVNNGPGGAADLMARIIAQQLGEALQQPVVVENKPGTSVGMVYAARQPADGYTIAMGSFSQVFGAPLLSKVPYDIFRDFEPVAMVATAPVVMVVTPASPYQSFEAVIAAARARPGALNYGSGGLGTVAHLLSESLNAAAGIRMQNVPYKSGIDSLNGLLASNLDVAIVDPQPALPHIRAGKLHALAVSGPERFSQLPAVPTLGELGLPQLTALNPWAIYMPAGVPAPVVARFREALDGVMEGPALKQRFADWGVDARHSSSAELRAFMVAETTRYQKVIQERNIRVD